MESEKKLLLDRHTSYKLSHYSKYNISDVFSDIHILTKEHEARVYNQLHVQLDNVRTPFVSFAEYQLPRSCAWLDDNEERFFKDTPNEVLVKVVYMTETGFICCMEYCQEGELVIVGHSTGLIQMRHGKTGSVLYTLRNIQFPPKPIYALHYSRTEERICYAASADGNIYRIEIPNIIPPLEDPPQYCIKADPALECLTMQFYGGPAPLSYTTPYVTQRSPALSFSVTCDESKMVVGYEDTSIKVYDAEKCVAITSYKVHKLRIQLIPPKLQRCHAGQVCALRCLENDPNMFGSAGWDNTLRIWDVRCNVGCIMTFAGVNAVSDSIDFNRDQCVVGSWQPSEALTVWDLKAKKRLTIIRVQNRRPDIDGEYIYACRYWKSKAFNRKGKYAIIGGSGTQCVEVINLHNRYISCSYPAEGTVLAITSHEDRIAFGGTAPVFNIVCFHDPKHEKYAEDDVLPDGEVWTGKPGEFFRYDVKTIKEATEKPPSGVDYSSNESSIDLI